MDVLTPLKSFKYIKMVKVAYLFYFIYILPYRILRKNLDCLNTGTADVAGAQVWGTDSTRSQGCIWNHPEQFNSLENGLEESTLLEVTMAQIKDILQKAPGLGKVTGSW